MNVGAMNRRVTSRGRTVALPQEKGVVDLSDHHLTRGSRHLSVTLEAEIGTPLHQHLVVHRAMRLVTGGAAFPHGFMFENKIPGLLAVALGAGLIGAGKGQPSRRLHDVVTVRVVALHAVHVPLYHRVARRQAKLRVHPHMALETGLRRLAGIHNQAVEGGSSARFHVAAARSVAGFTTGVDAIGPRDRVDSGVNASRKNL